MYGTKVVAQKPQNQKIAENALGFPLAAFRLSIACRWNMLQCHCNPRKTREVLQFALKKKFEIWFRGVRWVSLE